MGRGGATKMGGGSEVLPLQERGGGAEKVLDMLKGGGGHKKLCSSFNTGA